MIEPEEFTSNNHRSNFDIMAEILDASSGGVRKTYLMYRCNLSFKQLKSYSRFMLEAGLLCLHAQTGVCETRTFETTDKGRQFLRVYKGLKALMR